MDLPLYGEEGVNVYVRLSAPKDEDSTMDQLLRRCLQTLAEGIVDFPLLFICDLDLI